MRLWSIALFVVGSAFAADTSRPLFERDVLPILSANCWKCHGGENRKAGLDLRTPPLVARGSDKGPVVVKGSAEQSALYQKIAAGAMPPGKLLKLTKEQVEVVRRWIDSGADAARFYNSITKAEAGEVTDKDRQFWAFQKPVRPAVPKVRESARVHTPIDNFVLAKLEEKKLGYAPSANRRTLVRRAYLDLLGLPPSPEEVAAFVKDGNYNKLVDRNSDDVLKACEKLGIAFLPWYPLGDGAVLGIQKLKHLAKKLQVTPAQVGIAWLLAKSPVMLPIPGTSSVEHLEENVAAASLKLSADDLSLL